jgi:hypothetical protein
MTYRGIGGCSTRRPTYYMWRGGHHRLRLHRRSPMCWSGTASSCRPPNTQQRNLSNADHLAILNAAQRHAPTDDQPA